MKKNIFITANIVAFLLFPILLLANPYITTTAQKGNGILDLLDKYKLNKSNVNIAAFKAINVNNLNANGDILLNKTYILPIQVVKFDGKTIRSTLNINSYDIAKSIETYNLSVETSKIKKDKYKGNGTLWIPVDLQEIPDYFKTNKAASNTKDSQSDQENKAKADNNKNDAKIDYSFLTTNKDFKLKNSKLKGCVFYLISGHGGPDPGAICMLDENELREHEYAYDVTIRLAKKLLESNATVYMIVQDSSDGIRDVKILKNGGNEKLINGDTISSIQLTRLKQRTDLVNDFAKTTAKKKQMLLELHVDSRITDKRIDIFFYYRDGDKESEKLSNVIFDTIRKKYNKSQPGRGYKGNVSARDLHTLRNTSVPATYIELGNIQNPADQVRLLESNNRQAMANWIFDGIINYYKK